MSADPTLPPADGHADGDFRRRDRSREGKSSPRPRILLTAAAVIAVLLLVVSVLLVYRFLTAGRVSATEVMRDTVATSASPEVLVTSERGSVTVTSGEGPEGVEYEITGYGTGRDEAAAEESAAGVGAVVDSRRAEGDSPARVEISASGGEGADYAVRVPSGSSVTVESEAGPVDVSGVSGEVSVDSGAGDVTVSGVSGPVDISSEAGDVTVEDVNGETGSVVIEAGAGDVSLADLVIATLDVRVAAGSATVGGRFAGEGEISVDTGNIVIEAPEEDVRNVSLATEAGRVVGEDQED